MMIKANHARNVIRFRHGGVFEGMPWYAMEYFDGETLDQFAHRRTREGNPISPRELRDILLRVVTGLEDIQHIYEEHPGGDTRTFVHRDIKPTNVMIREGEKPLQVRLLDFGVSWLFEDEQRTTSQPLKTTILQSYTPSYASPEMLLPFNRPLDSRSDQFQIGLLAFEIVTRASYWDCRHRPTARLRDAMTRRWWHWFWLERCLERTLNWDPDQRFPTLRDFREAMEPKSWFKKLLRPSWWRQRLRPAWWTERPSRAVAGVTSLMSVVLIAIIMSRSVGITRSSTTSPDPPGSIARIWNEVEASFASCTSPSATPQNFQDLKAWCNKFLARTAAGSGYSDKRARVEKIRDWFKEAANWQVTVKPTKLSWHWGAALSHYPEVEYQIHAIDQNGSSPAPASGISPAGKGTFHGKAYTVNWDPGTRIQVEMHDGGSGKQTVKMIPLIPVKALRNEAARPQEMDLRGTSFKVFFQIDAKNVKPLPDLDK